MRLRLHPKPASILAQRIGLAVELLRIGRELFGCGGILLHNVGKRLECLVDLRYAPPLLLAGHGYFMN